MKLTLNKGWETPKIPELCETVAHIMGYNGDNICFDASKLFISKGIRNSLVENYVRFAQECDPTLSKADAMREMINLINICTNVDEGLAGNEVEVLPGFIVSIELK